MRGRLTPERMPATMIALNLAAMSLGLPMGNVEPHCSPPDQPNEYEHSHLSVAVKHEL